MNIKVCKSFELNERDWDDLVTGFNETFEREKGIKELHNHYKKNEFGYSFHSIARDNAGKFCGHTSVIPHYYKVDGERVLVGLSGGTFIQKEARSDIFLFKKMYDKLKEKCRIEGLSSIVGVPNKNSYKYTLKILKKIHLKDLNYYVLPVHPVQGNQIANNLIGVITKINSICQKWFSKIANFKEEHWPIEIEKSPAFLVVRLGEEYKQYKNDGIDGAYRMYDEEGKKVAYIMYFDENGRRTYRALASLIDEILSRENPDLIMYIGTLKLTQFLLLKLPKRFEPKKLPLTITLLGNHSKKVEQMLLKEENWDFGLINFDVR